MTLTQPCISHAILNSIALKTVIKITNDLTIKNLSRKIYFSPYFWRFLSTSDSSKNFKLGSVERYELLKFSITVWKSHGIKDHFRFSVLFTSCKKSFYSREITFTRSHWIILKFIQLRKHHKIIINIRNFG